ncbi:MAG: hypothetical protein ACYC0W_08585 [Candidatus Nanopelagicales bacterium]
MNPPRRPVFGFLWPRPQPGAAVDGANRQARPVRVAARGPLRVAVLVLGSLAVVVAAGTSMMAAVATGFSFATVVSAAVVASGVFLVLRGWVVGTYVNDDALLVETTWRRRVLPWSEVTGLDRSPTGCPLAGLPVPVRGERVIAFDAAGAPVPTHVYSTSPDLLLRAEAYDMTALRLLRWRQAAR